MDNHLDSFFAALSDPTRRAVVERLVAGPASVSDLHGDADMALPSFMKHLGKLERAGLIRSEKTGRTRMVQLETAPLQQAEAWLNRQRRMWEGRMGRLQAMADSLERKQQ